MTKQILLLVFVTFLWQNVSAQIPKCGDQLLKKSLEKEYPGVNKLIDATFDNAKSASPKSVEQVLTIPVVVHVIYNTPAQNISDELIQGQIDALTIEFRRMHPDAANTRDVFMDVAGDPMIEFALATTDPDGNATNGITRTATEVETFAPVDTLVLQAMIECGIDLTDPESFFENIECFQTAVLANGGGTTEIDQDAMKSTSKGGKEPWDTKKYLNIWITNMSVDIGTGPIPFLLGFAYPPIEAPNWPAGQIPENLGEVDGVVLHYQALGPNNPNAGSLAGLNDQGRTAVHEVGHYLGLRHIWGDGDCTIDDGISDTPAADSNAQQMSVVTCETMHNKDTCLDDDLPDMIENYMDYSIESCQNIFTIEQIQLMRAMLTGPRAGLVEGQFSDVNDFADLGLKVFPNPTAGTLQIHIDQPSDIDKIKVLDINGKVLMSKNQRVSMIDLSNFENGVYLLNVINKDGAQQIQKIIKN